jgi:hypothetical protein
VGSLVTQSARDKFLSALFFREILVKRFMQLALLVGALGMRLDAAELPVLHADDFEHGMDHWQPLGDQHAESPFAVVEVNGPTDAATHALRALGTSKYEPPFRSPPNVALLKDVTVGDFEITAKVQSTNVHAGPHRDMCIAWGYQDPSHFYYVHFGAASDPNACQIFIVDDAARTPITVKTATGTPWTEGWHSVKVIRRVEDGTIEVFFDDMDEPHMTAKDTRFQWGQVGLGTFDDNGNWDDFELRGVQLDPATAK